VLNVINSKMMDDEMYDSLESDNILNIISIISVIAIVLTPLLAYLIVKL